MAKRFISGFMAIIFALWLCLPAAAAGAQAARTVGTAVPDGEYELPMRSDNSLTDLTHSYYYSESFFDHPSTEYDHALATATLGLSLACFSSVESDYYYWKGEGAGRENNIKTALERLGFANAEFYNYDIDLNTYSDYVAYAIGQKTLIRDGERQTVIALMLRGGGYGAEWASNIALGSGEVHEGFTACAEEVFETLQNYLAAARKNGKLGKVKLWLGGYSRGGAVAGLVAARIAHEMPDIDQSGVYVYTFAAPAVATDKADSKWKLDFNNNYNSDGTLKSDWDESNIFNILGSGDLVPQVPPANWGYCRNGADRYLPMPSQSDEIAALNALSAQINPDGALDFAKLGTASDVNLLITSAEKVFTDKTTYCTQYQAALEDMMEVAFQLSEAEVTQGAVLGKDAVMRRLYALRNMQNTGLDEIVLSVLAASSMTNALLDRFGKNVPLRIKQLAMPLLATGLCHRIEGDLLQLLVQYAIGVVSVRSAPGQAVNVFRCHFPEVYIALMEYYSPLEHGLQAYTR